MTAAAIFLVVVALLAATGLAIAAVLRLRSLPELVLAGFVVAFAEVVALALVLSLFDAVGRPVLLTALVAICGVAVALWWRAGRPLPPIPALRASPSPLVALAVVVGLALTYVVALVVGTAPNTWDSLVYHLTRSALWRQDGGAGYIGDAYDERLNANPPNAEVVLTFVLELTRDDRFAGFVQLVAALACATAVYALARRLGLASREAAFGALLVLTLPIVVLQSSTTQNDLVVAALLLAATVFALGDSRPTLALTGVAVALAMGTKVTAVFALPVLCAVALAAPPRAARGGRIAAVAMGAAGGSYWYLVNLAETGRLLGQRPDTELLAIGDLRENVLSAFARVLDAFDLSGAEATSKLVLTDLLDSDILVYVLAAAALAGALLVTQRDRRLALGAGALALLPLAIPPVGYVLWRVFAKLHDVLEGPGEPLPAGEWPPQTTASESLSWFGPLGLFLVVGVASVVLSRRRSWTSLALVLATAPLAWLVLFSLTIGYDIWQGRFFVYPVALSAALWGIVLRRAAVAWAVVAVGAATVALSLVNSLEKPSGLDLFADRSTETVWGKERWEVQSLPRPEMAPVLRFLEERVPEDAVIALALGENDFGYPAFGRTLEREVELVLGSPANGSDVEWLVANPNRAPDTECWRPVLVTPEGWTVSQAVEGCAP